MSPFTSRELRRETLQRAVYSRLNSHPDLARKFMYSDSWLIARHAVDAMLEVEDTNDADGGALPPSKNR